MHDEYFNFFFRDMCVNDYLIMILPFLMDKNLPFDAEERSEEALRRLLEESYLFIYNSGGYLERISQCESSDFNAYIEAGMSGDELRAVAERPSLYLTALARLIRENVPVMEDAWSLVREEAQALSPRAGAQQRSFFQRAL